MRILHGVSSSAGQPSTISRAQRALGYDSSCVLLGPSKFDYPADYSVPYGEDAIHSAANFLKTKANDFDVFHFYFRPFFYFSAQMSLFPSGLDLLALKAAGKKIILHYRGSEVRSAAKFKELSPFNYVNENPDEIFSKFNDNSMKRWHQYMLAVCDQILVPDIELQSYVPEAKVLPRAIDLTQWEPVGSVADKNPLVVHAPSRRSVKGTDYILKAVEELQNEGLKFRFDLVENLTNEEAQHVYKSADILIDQLRIGWYGVLAVEAMALQKTVIAYIREDLLPRFEGPLPLLNANPNTVKEVLKKAITNSQLRKEVAARGRLYCEKTHDAKVVAEQAIQVYENVPSKNVDLTAAIEHMEWLYQHRRDHLGNNPVMKFYHVARQKGLATALSRTRQKMGL